MISSPVGLFKVGLGETQKLIASSLYYLHIFFYGFRGPDLSDCGILLIPVDWCCLQETKHEDRNPKVVSGTSYKCWS